MQAWIASLLAHWSAKAIAAVLGAVIVLGCIYGFGRHEYHKGYNQCIADHPQNSFTGPTTVNQLPVVTCSVYGLQLGRLGLGVVYKK